MKKQFNLAVTLSIFILLVSCSGPKASAPGSIENSQIEFFVQKTIDTETNRNKQKFLYKFHKNNTYKVTMNGAAVYAGGYSYNVLNKTRARVVCTYSTNNELASYEMILEFESPTNGTWESSYNNDTMGSEGGSFVFVNWEKNQI